MSKYIIDFPSVEASALFEYNTDGNLIAYELTPGNYEKQHFDYLMSHFPTFEKHLEYWKKINVVKVKQVEEDLSFERFWKEYDYKVGNKLRAEKIWKSLPKPEKAKALLFLPAYTSHLIITKIAKQYPETYLNQKRWNN